jgi:hypothetical protein
MKKIKTIKYRIVLWLIGSESSNHDESHMGLASLQVFCKLDKIQILICAVLRNLVTSWIERRMTEYFK